MGKIHKLMEAKKGGVLWLSIIQYFKRLPYKKKNKKYFEQLSNMQLQQRCCQILHKIRKQYRKETETRKARILAEDAALPHAHNKIIWICWFQGIGNAPDIVKMCYHSICQKFGREFQIILLDEVTVNEYVRLPDSIEEKYKAGFISRQTYADLIRLALLDKYGGTWMDATIFYSGGDVPPYLMESDLFAYQTLFPATWGIATTTNSYFITACQNNKIIKLAKELLFRYWERNKLNCDYWLVYDFLEIAKDAFPEEWAKVIPEGIENMHILQARAKDQFDQRVFNAVIARTSFHKLQWRFVNDDYDWKGTYLEYLLKHYTIHQSATED